MSILNAKNNLFIVSFQDSMFYPEIVKEWQPVIKRLKLPFEKISDFINSCVQSVTWPNINLENVEQQQSQYKVSYKGGKELEPILEKNIDITFKLSEGFFSYWILFGQIEKFLEYKEDDVFWPSMFISFLDLNGFEILSFEFKQIIPTSLSQFSLSYSQTTAEFNTFTLGLKYNKFNIIRRLNNEVYTFGKNKYND